VALIVTTIVWGGSFVAIKLALRYLSPLQLVFMRFVPAALAFAVLAYVRHRASLSRLLRREWLSLLSMGLTGVVIYHLALNTGEQSIPAGTASLIMALNPAFIFVLSVIFLGERANRQRALGLVVAFVGLSVVIRFAGGEQIDFRYLRGVLLTLIAPISWAVYTIVSQPLAARHPPLAVTALGTILGTLPILGITGSSPLRAAIQMPLQGWASVAFLGLACTVGGVTAWVSALEHLHPSQVGAFIYLVPLWGALLSRWWLGEALTAPFLVGAVAIIAGVMMVNQ
jgi:drug/metabolite transporter (DMT)-like permease